MEEKNCVRVSLAPSLRVCTENRGLSIDSLVRVVLASGERGTARETAELARSLERASTPL